MRCLLFALMLPSLAGAQLITPELLTVLPVQLNETSGLAVIDGAVWTVLDSGNPAAVHHVDPTTGAVVRTVQLLGASNVDYEDITADASWVYIGDFGNNSGSRTDLRVYRIPRIALEDEGITEVQVDTIRFSFADQVDFTPAFNGNNFDCEAFVAADDSLFLFTKRWIDETTRLYAVSAMPGTHEGAVRGDYDTDGLITAASWDGANRLVLLGHEDDPGQPFIIQFNAVQGHDFFGQPGIRRQVDLFDHQTEGIAWLTPDEWILSNELANGFLAALWSVDVLATFIAARSNEGIRAYPMPASDRISFAGSSRAMDVELHDATGRVVLITRVNTDGPVDVSGLAAGRYVARIDCLGSESRLPIVIAR
jgi:hypothetical protein